jgi:AraC-like DNA-binding protein
MNEARASSLQVFRFSTNSYQPHERIAAWREVFGRVLLNIDITPRSKEAFHASATAYRSSTFGLIDVSTAPTHQGNHRSLITSDDVCFGVATNSRWQASQLRRTADLQPGDALLMNNGEVGEITFPNECRYFAFSIPRSAIAPLVPDIDALFAGRTPASNPALQMLMRYLELARDDSVVTTPELETAFTNHVCDLLALAIGPTRDAAELASTRGLYAARLHAMKQDIRRSLGRPNLSVHSIAARYRVSARYVQKLFEESDCTFTRFVMEERLAATHKALTARNDTPINTIAYDIGFNDISNFNRAFRQRFGCTPSEVRKAARTLDDDGT